MTWWNNDPLASGEVPVQMQAAQDTANWWQNDPAPPKQEGWGEWLANTVKGRHDPNYAAAESNPRLGMIHRDVGNAMANAGLLNASDEQLADIATKTLGKRLVRREKDANGYDVFMTRGDDGKEYASYLNKPGLDAQDVARFTMGAAPFLASGGLALGAGAGRGLAANVALQGVTAGSTSMAADAGLSLMGSEQGIDPAKAAIAAGFGAAGPIAGKAVGALWQRFIQEPKYFDRATGMLTAEGQAAAKQLGMDPATMAADAQRTFGKTYAASPQDAAKMVDSGQLNFNVPQTLGQRTKDPEQLMVEKAMRHGTYGDNAKTMLTGLDTQQKTAINAAMRETIPTQIATMPGTSQNWQTGIQGVFSGGKPIEKDFLGEVLGGSIKGARGAAGTLEDKAWDGIGVLRATPQALEDLPNAIKSSLSFAPDETLHPATWRMLQRLNAFTKGEKFGSNLDILGPDNTGDLDTLRRQLLSASQSTTNKADATLASGVYKSFNNWMLESAKKQLLLGNEQDAAKLVSARDVTRTIHDIFEPSVKGKATPGAAIIKKVLEQDTPERVIDAVFSGPRAGIKDGSLEAIKRMRMAVDTYGDKAAAQDLWASLKVAHWSKLVQGKDGQLLDNKVILNNIRTAFANQRSLMDTLYTRSDREIMLRAIRMLEGVTYKDPNPSGTATGVAVLAKQMFGKLMQALGPIGQTAIEYSGLPKAYGTAVARRAVSQAAPNARAPIMNLHPAAAAATVAADRSSGH